MRDIKPPVGVDSLGKLNEWLVECGIPQADHENVVALQTPPRIEHEEWGLGFRFPADDRDMANAKYRELIQGVADQMFERWGRPTVGQIIWRVRPQLDENVLRYKTMADGSPVDWDAYEALDEDDRPELIEHFDESQRIAILRCRVMIELV